MPAPPKIAQSTNNGRSVNVASVGAGPKTSACSVTGAASKGAVPGPRDLPVRNGSK